MKLRIFIFQLLLCSICANSQIITTIAGDTVAGYSGDGGLAIYAKFNQPQGIVSDSVGNIYIADAGNNVVRKIDTAGIITTFAGNGFGAGTGLVSNLATGGAYSGDGGLATQAQLNCPFDVAIDKNGNVYIADAGNHVIRKVNTLGIITTVAGNGLMGYSGNWGIATSAKLRYPQGVAVDNSGNIYISDSGNDVVRKVLATSGIIKRIAGGGTQFPGNGGLATSCVMSNPCGIKTDSRGNVFFIDEHNDRIRKINSSGIISTYAGNSGFNIPNGYAGDGGPAISATLNTPQALALDNCGNLFLADTWNFIVRRIDNDGIINTFAGTPNSHGYSGDGGIARNAKMYTVTGVAIDSKCNLFISDGLNNVIRKVSFGQTSFTDSVNIKNIECGNSWGSLSIVPPASGYSPYLYNIGSGNQSSNVFSNLNAGIYTYTITNNLGCAYCPESTFSISKIDTNNLNIFVSPDTACLNERILVSTPNKATSYQWLINKDTINSMGFYYSFNTEGSYRVKLIMEIEPGSCIDTISKAIIVNYCPPDTIEVNIPNIFTPNNDGLNELWTLTISKQNYDIKDFSCKIYDRWGVKIYETKDWNFAWNGRALSGANVVDGTYFYTMTIRGTNSKARKSDINNSYKGFFELIR